MYILCLHEGWWVVKVQRDRKTEKLSGEKKTRKIMMGTHGPSSPEQPNYNPSDQNININGHPDIPHYKTTNSNRNSIRSRTSDSKEVSHASVDLVNLNLELDDQSGQTYYDINTKKDDDYKDVRNLCIV